MCLRPGLATCGMTPCIVLDLPGVDTITIPHEDWMGLQCYAVLQEALEGLLSTLPPLPMASRTQMSLQRCCWLRQVILLPLHHIQRTYRFTHYLGQFATYVTNPRSLV